MNPRDILERAARTFGVPVAELTGPSRARHITQARFAAAWAIHTRFPAMALAAIGQVLGGRDHSTVASAIQRAETLARHDSAYRAQMRSLLDEAPQPAAPQPPEPVPVVEISPGARWWLWRAYGRRRITSAA